MPIVLILRPSGSYLTYWMRCYTKKPNRYENVQPTGTRVIGPGAEFRNQNYGAQLAQGHQT